MLEDNQIEKILASSDDPQRCAAQLVNEAIGRGGYDNVTVIVVDITGLAEQHRRKMTRRSRATAIMLGVLLVGILGVCAYGFNYLANNSAYLAEENGKVAIYQGVPGDVFGFSAHKLVRVTDVGVDDLQPGTANRLREEGIKVDSVEAAERLVSEYEADAAGRTDDSHAPTGGEGVSGAAGRADGSDVPASGGASGSTAAPAGGARP